MDIRKEFMLRFRKQSFKEVFIVLNVDIFPHLVNYVEFILDIKFEDGSYHTHYGELKKVIRCFLTYFDSVIDDVIQEADKCANVQTDRYGLTVLIDRTIDLHQSRHIYFGRRFLPVQSSVEKDAYEEMEELYNQYMEKLFDLKSLIERLDRPEKVDDFTKDHFKISVKETSDLFKMTHVFITMMLADRIDQIKVSLEENHLGALNNLRKVRAECNETLQMLLQQLYEKNKAQLQVSRKANRNSIDMAEVTRSIDRIRSKIEEYSYDEPLHRLEELVAYWEDRLEDFRQIAGRLLKLKKEQEDVTKQEEIYNSLKTTELPGSKRQCFLKMGENFAQRKEYLKEQIIEAAKPLMSFFSIRGTDRLFYTDDVGIFYMDEYNHQVYTYDYGMGLYHVNCEGDFKQGPYLFHTKGREADLGDDTWPNVGKLGVVSYCEISEQDIPRFDLHGRYVITPGGEKVYQCAPCTSTYKLTDVGLLDKTTKDCGHSKKINTECRLHIKDPRSGAIMPDAKNIDIKSTLNTEVVQYLWDSFGHVLPFALHDVGVHQPKNPIHHLAHSLLLHKYNKTKAQLKEKMKEAHEYRANIFKERKDKAIAASKAWKAKQVKPRKPEESDDADNQAVYTAAAADQVYQATMAYMNYD